MCICLSICFFPYNRCVATNTQKLKINLFLQSDDKDPKDHFEMVNETECKMACVCDTQGDKCKEKVDVQCDNYLVWDEKHCKCSPRICEKTDENTGNKGIERLSK